MHTCACVRAVGIVGTFCGVGSLVFTFMGEMLCMPFGQAPTTRPTPARPRPNFPNRHAPIGSSSWQNEVGRQSTRVLAVVRPDRPATDPITFLPSFLLSSEPPLLGAINSIGLHSIGPKENPSLSHSERNKCANEYSFLSWTGPHPHDGDRSIPPSLLLV